MPRLRGVLILVGSAWAVPGCDPVLESLGDNPRAFSVADVNGDGRADLVAVSTAEPPGAGGLEREQILTRLGNGDGSFGALQRSAGPYDPESTFFMNANGDAHADLVVARFFGNAAIFNGDGSGHFRPGAILVNGCERSPGGAAGDLNGDAYQDVALLCSDEGFSYMTTHFGTAGGAAFTFGQSYTLLPTTRGLSADVAIGDLNGDGKQDVVVAGFSDGDQVVIPHLNDGTGNLEILPPVPAGGRAVALADFDGDSILDAVTGGAALIVLRGLGDGSLSGWWTLGTPAGESITDVAAADINGDGRQDVIATTANRVHSFPSSGTSNYVHREHPTGPFARDLNLVDLNGDRRIDAVNLNRGASVSVHFNVVLR